MWFCNRTPHIAEEKKIAEDKKNCEKIDFYQAIRRGQLLN